MPTAIEYQKVMTEIVYINLPGPDEPLPGMSGGELLHGFLTELYRGGNPDIILADNWFQNRDDFSTQITFHFLL